MKGVIYSVNPQAIITDISHTIEPQDIVGGAYVLYYTTHLFPDNTVHVAVIDPDVGTQRGMLIIRTRKGLLVGPDNGLLLPAARRMGVLKIHRIENTKLFRQPVAPTFHGRDIMAPVAARLDMGMDPSEAGPETPVWTELDIFAYRMEANEVHGRVLHVDEFGNLVTNIPYSEVEKHYRIGDRIPLILDRRSINIPLVESYMGHQHRYLVALASSDGMLEIAHPNHSAAALLKTEVGHRVILEW